MIKNIVMDLLCLVFIFTPFFIFVSFSAPVDSPFLSQEVDSGVYRKVCHVIYSWELFALFTPYIEVDCSAL